MAGFAAFVLFALILGLWKREFALYLAFLELTMGSFGYLLSFHAWGLNLSLRMALFAVIMGLWAYDLIVNRKSQISSFKINRRAVFSLALFLIIWIFGILEGYLRGNNLADIALDSNSYLFLLLFFPAIAYINTKEKLDNLLKIILVGAGATALLTFLLLITFSKLGNQNLLEIIYKWVRDFRIGEITPLKNGSYRIFLQSQIYVVMGLLIVSARHLFKDINFKKFLIFGALSAGAIYLSLSRSLWIGTVAGIIALFIFSLCIMKRGIIKPLIRVLAVIFIGILIASMLTPKSSLQNRFIIGEAAADTRISQLKVLAPAIAHSPIFGYGFGKTLTYKSFDPRLGDSKNGNLYTTYAFELGYLDIILKIGIFGLLVLMYFISIIAWRLFKNYKENPQACPYSLWALSGLIALLAIHIFTPYINHPLGIGILILAGTAASIDKK